MITTTLWSSCHWKKLVPFCLRKKRNTKRELSQTRREKQMPFKITVNWLFNDIWCYLVIGCFDWKNWRFSLNSCKGFIISLKIVLMNIVTILMMSAKMVTLGLLKIKVFWNRGYNVIISVYNINNKN